jgi:uncharacterized protein
MAGTIQRILITGGTGLIGVCLTERLLRDGKEVWVLSRNPLTANAPAGAQLVGWDGRTTEGWLHLIDQVDAVIHLAGANLGGAAWTNARRREIVESRVESGQAVAGAFQASSARPRVLVQASAIGYYGESETASFTEKDPPGDGWLETVCIAWENATRNVDELGVRRVILRTGLVLDRDQGILPKIALPFRLGVGGVLGSGRQWMSWIHIEDEINAILYLLGEETAHGAYNLTAPNPLRNAEFEQAMGQALHRPAWIPTPEFAIKLAVGKMSELVLKGQWVLPERLLAAGFPFRYEDLPAALAGIYG